MKRGKALPAPPALGVRPDGRCRRRSAGEPFVVGRLELKQKRRAR